MSLEDDGEHTGLSVNYYQVRITRPTTPGRPVYIAECNDIIEALNMTFAEANVFKAQWRIAAERTLGLKKKGNNPLYDSEKIVFFGQRQVVKYTPSPEDAQAGTSYKTGFCSHGEVQWNCCNKCNPQITTSVAYPKCIHGVPSNEGCRTCEGEF